MNTLLAKNPVRRLAASLSWRLRPLIGPSRTFALLRGSITSSFRAFSCVSRATFRSSIVITLFRGELLFGLVFFALTMQVGAQGQSQVPVQSQGKGPVEVTAPTLPSNAKAGPITTEAQNKLAIINSVTTSKSGIATNDVKGSTPSFQGQALNVAKDKIKNNDLSGAENILTVNNPFAPNTANWHLDTSRSLMDLANQMSKEADRKNVPAVVTQALQHLDTSGTLARQTGDVQGQAQAKAAAAYIYERYRGDTASAIASYQAALQLQPNDKALQEALERLQTTDANLKARLQSRKR